LAAAADRHAPARLAGSKPAPGTPWVDSQSQGAVTRFGHG